MSRARIAGLVCEGQTDVPIIRAMLQEIWPEIEEVRCLQPELDEMERAKGPAGWSEVRTWCEMHADNLAEVLDPDVGDRIDLLLIAIDVDIAIEAKIADPPREIGLYETKRLRDVIASWLKNDKKLSRVLLPEEVVISTPVMAIEAWVVAAIYRTEKAAENIQDPAAWLMKKKKLRASTRTGKPWKELHVYQDFAEAVAKQLSRVRRVCAEADRTSRAVERRRLELNDE